MSIDPCNIVVEGKTYSAEKLARIHPGGSFFIKAFSGKEASFAFLSYHRRNFPHSRIKETLLYEGEDSANKPGWKDDFMELNERVEKILPRNKGFAPWYYYVKACLILFTAFFIEYYMHSRAFYHPLLCACLGYLFASIGLNIQHDANHGAISRRPWINRVFGLSQNWIGGSAVCWVHQHVVQHHIYTNHVDLDPDLDGGLFIRINPTHGLMKFHVVQHIYFFILLTFYGFSVIFNTLINVINGTHFTPMSVLLKKHRIFEVLTSLFFIFRIIMFPIYQVPKVETVLSIFLFFAVGGYYLSLFFSISHNFKEVEVFNEKTTTNSFFYNQVATSSNVGGPILCFLNGGLNYQIEHHLFPRVNHCHYPKIAPIVEEFCREKKIPYTHFPTVLDNIESTIAYLFKMGNVEKPFPGINVYMN